MKLLILSDSHGSLYYPRMVIQKLKDRIDVIIHLGDHEKDAIKLMKEFPSLLLHYVGGNCDFGSIHKEKIIPIANKKILMTHGHRQDVKWGYDRIGYYGEEKEVDIVLFGHTHMPLIENYGEMLLFNPGSISQPRGIIYPTFGIIEIEEEGKVEPAIMAIKKDNELSRLWMV
ncbi:MAG: metallophosphoesterase [Epulopiscium sp.]|nr:metallophosphoesterase [Candidatus Epulonipiscium sp.]